MRNKPRLFRYFLDYTSKEQYDKYTSGAYKERLVNWQEYQEAVGKLYEQMEGIGEVHKSITIPDKITQQPRQIDVWLEVDMKGHKIGILIDAKFRKEKLDVKDIEEVLSLANAVGANKSVIVALNGWTEPAQIKANVSGLDLRLWTLEQALDVIVPDKWIMCGICENDCIVLEYGGGFELNGVWSLLSVGQCRECRAVLARCWSCGQEMLLRKDTDLICICGHTWKNTNNKPSLQVKGDTEWILLDKEAVILDNEAIKAYNEKGFYFRKQGDLAQAVKYFTKVVELVPLSAKAHFNRGHTLDEAGLLELAIYDYTQAIAIEPDFAMAYASRGVAYYVSGKFNESIVDLEKFLKLNPNAKDKKMIVEIIKLMRAKLAQ